MRERETSGPRRPMYPPFAHPGPRETTAVIPRVPEAAADPPAEDELPAIEQFLDALPSIDDYLDDTEPDAEGWAVAGWQKYDWSSLASLGRQSAEQSEADASWSQNEWAGSDAESPGGEGDWASGGPTAEEVAFALDGIAARIRSGELPIDQFRGMPPEAAMAAALAALLKLRG